MNFACLGRSLAEFNAGVDVLGVLAEDHDIDQFGMLHRAGNASVVLHRPNALVEVHQLAQRFVQAVRMPPPTGVVKRPFNRDARSLPWPSPCRRAAVVLRLAIALLAGQHLVPLHAALAACRLFRRRRRRRVAKPSKCRGRCRRLRWKGMTGMVRNGVGPVGVLNCPAVCQGQECRCSSSAWKENSGGEPE